MASAKTSEERSFGRLAKEIWKNAPRWNFILNDVKRLKLSGVQYQNKTNRIFVFELEKFGREENVIEIIGNLKFEFWWLQPSNPGLFGVGRSITESRSIVEGLKWVASAKTSEERNFGRLAKEIWKNAPRWKFILNDVTRLKLSGVQYQNKTNLIFVFVFRA